MKIADLILVQKGKSSQLGVLLSARPNQMESISASGHLMIHSKRDVKFASLQWGLSLEQTRATAILPAFEKKIRQAGMDLGVLSHLSGFNTAAVNMQQKISPLVVPFHSSLDPTTRLDLETIAKQLFKTTDPTPAQKYSVVRILEDTLYFTRNSDPYNPIFKPRTEPEVTEIKQLLNMRIGISADVQDFITKSQSLISSFRSGQTPKIDFSPSDIRLISKLIHALSLFPDPINIEIRAYQHLIQKIYQIDKSYLREFVMLLKEIGVFRKNEDLTAFKKSDGKRMKYLEAYSSVGRRVVKEIEGLCGELVNEGPFVYGPEGSMKSGGKLVENVGRDGSLKVDHDHNHDHQNVKVQEYKSHIIHAKSPTSTTFPQKDEMEKLRIEINQTVYVIDDAKAHELDDGVSLEKTAEGDWIHVHIANPTAYIPPSHPLSYHAQLRASSIYLPHTHYPMMSDNLARNLLDLGVSKCALTFSARLDGRGEICDYKVTPTLINRPLKVTYEEIDSVLSWDSVVGFKNMEANPVWIKNHFKYARSYKSERKFDSTTMEDLRILQNLADLHSRRRFQNGGFHPDVLNYNLKTTEPQSELLPLKLKHSFQGEAFTKPSPTLRLNPFEASQRSPAKLFVQEFMVIAGRVAARYAQDHKLPVGYRIQNTMIEHHNELYSLDIDREKIVREMTSLLENSIDRENGAVSEEVYRKLIAFTAPAKISQIPGKHANMGIKVGGDGFGGYLKVTSPLRRYLDMHSHYQIQASLLNKPVPFDEEATAKISERMVKVQSRIAHFQRQSSRYWMLEYIRRKAFKNDGGFIAPPLDHLLPFEGNLMAKKREVAVVLGGGGFGVHSYFISLPYYGGFMAKMKPMRSKIEDGAVVDVVFDRIDPDQGIILASEV